MGDRATNKIVIELGDSSKPNSYRYLLAEFVGVQKSQEARPILETILADTSENALLRHRAARSLGIIGDSKSLQPLLMALDDSERLVRQGAAKGLGRLKNPAAAQKLIQKLKPDSEDKAVNLRICYALGEIKGNNARRAMLDLMKHQNPSYRYAAVRALGRMGDKSATLPLIDLLHEEKGIRRGEIMKALAKIGDDRAIPVLIDEVRDGEPLSVGKAAEALVELKGIEALPNLRKAMEKETNQNAFTRRKLQKALDALADDKEGQ
jgi:HEAT repeat protein